MSELTRHNIVALCISFICLFAATTTEVMAKGELSSKDARNLIRRLAGVDLPSGAIRIKTISSPSGATEAVALAQIETAFRFEMDDRDRWRIAEIRTGDNRWEDLGLIARAARVETPGGPHSETSAIEWSRPASSLDARLAREILARFAGVALPSDAVRVKELSSLYNSAVVLAQVEAEFRFDKGVNKKWRVAQIRTGDGRWTDVELLVRLVNAEKARRARVELEMMAVALASFRRERGFYVVADTSGALLDQLHPLYLPRVIRLDPWRKPYLYEGERDSYVLRSTGADGKPDTADDINLSSKTQSVGNIGR